ncbi:MAG: spore germination protein [Clostridiaceae bacterium]|nr:spore germination protein [Clostridiaceae bacterium]
MDNSRTIKDFGLFSTVIVVVIGVRAFSYVRELANYVGNDGWLITIVSGLISLLLILCIYKLILLNNFNSFSEICINNAGRFIGSIFQLSMVVFIILNISLSMRGFIEEIKMYLLENTPTEFLTAITILAAIYLVSSKVNVLIKFNEAAFWIIFIPTSIIFLFSLYQADFTNLLPVLSEKPINYFTGTIRTINRFEGIEIIFLVLPLLKSRDKIRKTLVNSIFFITIFYTVITLLVIAVFTKEQAKILVWPVITMIKSINIQGAFIERWDGIVLSIWIFFFFTTFTSGYYFSADILKNTFKIRNNKIAVLLLIPFIYATSLYPSNVAENEFISNWVLPLLFFINVVCIPLLLLIITKIKGKGVENNSKEINSYIMYNTYHTFCMLG